MKQNRLKKESMAMVTAKLSTTLLPKMMFTTEPDIKTKLPTIMHIDAEILFSDMLEKNILEMSISVK